MTQRRQEPVPLASIPQFPFLAFETRALRPSNWSVFLSPTYYSLADVDLASQDHVALCGTTLPVFLTAYGRVDATYTYFPGHIWISLSKRVCRQVCCALSGSDRCCVARRAHEAIHTLRRAGDGIVSLPLQTAGTGNLVDRRTDDALSHTAPTF
ncbi:hypothetical protein M426DRAFT_8406 [Hypoxylon sp. CI-4A]|nr:hypothetical protein M426DRAFT_8406 [Hypoxylon sp. CI-4A]